MRPRWRKKPKYDALTKDELRLLYKECRTPQMRRALWEIFRLREIVVQASQLVRLLEYVPINGRGRHVFAEMREQFKYEPAVAEDDADEKLHQQVQDEMRRKQMQDRRIEDA